MGDQVERSGLRKYPQWGAKKERKRRNEGRFRTEYLPTRSFTWDPIFPISITSTSDFY